MKKKNWCMYDVDNNALYIAVGNYHPVNNTLSVGLYPIPREQKTIDLLIERSIEAVRRDIGVSEYTMRFYQCDALEPKYRRLHQCLHTRTITEDESNLVPADPKETWNKSADFEKWWYSIQKE